MGLDISSEMLSLDEAAALVAKFEGFMARPYSDSAGIPTIGYGTIRYPNGKQVTLNDLPITSDTALVYLQNELMADAQRLWAALRRLPNHHQWAAMCSLIYNIGWPNMLRPSTVLRCFNAGDIPGAASGFLMWDKIHRDGQLVLSVGLLKRRQAEQAIFLTPD